MDKHLKIAVFIDFDNIEIGVKSTLQREFDVSIVLEALKERGEIITKIAYANWGRLENSTRQLSEYAVQMVQRDPSPRGDKNGGRYQSGARRAGTRVHARPHQCLSRLSAATAILLRWSTS